MKYKALSVVAPAGQWIAEKRKTIEVRSWICDLQPNEDLVIVENQKYLHKEGQIDEEGRAIAIVRVSQIRPFVESDMKASCANYFAEGYFSWELTDVRPIRPIKNAIAARSIYEIELSRM